MQCAQEPRTTTFSELTDELGLPAHYNRSMGWVFKHIVETLAQLESRDDWEEGEIPHITSIVLKANGKCSRNMCKLLTGDYDTQPSCEQLQTELDCSFCYEKWDAVLDALFDLDDITCLVGKNELGKTAILHTQFQSSKQSNDRELEMSRTIPAQLRRRVLCEAGHRCAIHTCRQIEVEIHHIVPWSKRREHNYENLIALCRNCHKRADRGDIDRKALRIYKANLRYAHDRFSQYEVDILFLLHSRQEIQFLPFMMLLINRILDTGYIDVVENRSVSMQVAGMEMSPVYISLTRKGQEYIDSLGIDQGN